MIQLLLASNFDVDANNCSGGDCESVISSNNVSVNKRLSLSKSHDVKEDRLYILVVTESCSDVTQLGIVLDERLEAVKSITA
jgi:hypothetical protein